MTITNQAAKRLLILDDDPMIGQTIKAIAEFAGLLVQFTSRPDEFFHAVDTWLPTHIAIDLIMPEMDGVQVLALLAERHCTARIIITSGVGTRVLDAAGRSAAEHGLNIIGVLAKPFTPTNLRRLLTDDLPTNRMGDKPGGSGKQRSVLDAADLRQALAQNAIVPYYQPKISCATGELAGFEVLARWIDPERGVIPPGQFISIAETNGLIDTLTSQILTQALAWFAPLAVAGSPISPFTHLSINISARTLTNAELFEHVRQECQTLQIDPERLTFELTETSAMDDPTASLDLLTRLRMHGFHLSIDDFGTGFSSMLQLVRLPFSEIKVDKSFVLTALDSQESRTVIRFIVELGHSLGLRCTGEGVEDPQILDYLRQVGCDMAQGYAIARPMPGEEARRWAQNLNR
ncbi:MAG TPA: EAL domain-containing response regulator [Roseiflexaceae bacterium]|nr:EAL domain-containing response regulator [Roseiflexaceae bacterium]HMP40228.1 EAL domain-containing response regulator [Roseiflexaceae bacterium]